MPQDYDKIFKENIEELILPLAGKLLNIYPKKLEEIPDDLQATIERKPDFLKKVLHRDKKQNYILHIEFQTEDDKDMPYRMLEYYSLLLLKYKLEVKQYVFFIGKRKSKMMDKLSFPDLNFSYKIINLIEQDYRNFLDSSKPEEIILAVLGDFGAEKPKIVAKNVLIKLQTLKISKSNLKKSFIQLEILSKLRNLQSEIIQELKAMAFTYHLESDLRYKQGKEENAISAIQQMLIDNLPFERIAKYQQVSIDFVKKVADSFKK